MNECLSILKNNKEKENDYFWNVEMIENGTLERSYIEHLMEPKNFNFLFKKLGYFPVTILSEFSTNQIKNIFSMR